MKRVLSLLLALAMLLTALPMGVAFAAAEDGLLLHYEMKDNTAVYDSAGDYDGTLRGSTEWVEGLSAYAVQLAGGEDYIQVPNAALTQSSDITLSMWVRLDQISTWTSLFVAGNGQSNYVVWAAMGTPSGNRVGMTLAIKQNGGQEYRVAAPDGTVPAVGEWSLVTYTQSGTTATLYLNGNQVGRVTNMQGSIKGVLDAAPASTSRIGDNHVWPDPSMVGAVSEVMVYNRVLTADELKAEVAAKADAAAKLELQAAADSIDLGDLTDVMDDLDLADTAENGVKIAWTSSNENFVTNDGKVTLPTAAQGDQEITLTAVLSSDKTDQTITKEFTFMLYALNDERYAKIAADFIQRYVDYLINDGYELPTRETIEAKLGEEYGCNIQWALTDGVAEMKDGKIYKTAASAERQPIKLKAKLLKGDAAVEVKFDNVTLMDEYAAYILSFFGGDDGKQELHLAYSYDGLNWQKLGDGNSVLGTTMGSGAVRDPYILRKKDGSFAVIATQGWDNNSIYLWDSADLVDFTGERLRQVSYSGVAGLTGARAWAPEASYDPIKDEYIIYWSDPYANGGKGNLYANTTTDLNTFSQPFVFFDAGYQIIDANIIKWQGSYYMMFKDERGNNSDGGGGKHILMAKSDSLEPGSFEQYTGPVTEAPVEGPFIFQVLGEEKWYHYYDYFNEHKFGVSVSTDLDSGEWEFLGKSTTMPTDDVRHGGVVPVTADELDRILEGYDLTETITAIEEPEEVKGFFGTAFEDLDLPETVKATTAAGVKDVAVTWSADGYDADMAGTYTITGTLAEDLSFADGVSVSAKVTLEVDEAVEAVEAMIDELPNPSTVTDENFEAFCEQVQVVETAFDALTTAQQNRVTEDRYQRLMECIYLAESGLSPAPPDEETQAVIDLMQAIPYDEMLALPSAEEIAVGVEIDMVRFKELATMVRAAETAYNALTDEQRGEIHHEITRVYRQNVATINELEAVLFIPGDVDFSGVVDVADIMKIKDLIMTDNWNDDQLRVGDLSGNGALDVADIMGMKNIIMSN